MTHVALAFLAIFALQIRASFLRPENTSTTTIPPSTSLRPENSSTSLRPENISATTIPPLRPENTSSTSLQPESISATTIALLPETTTTITTTTTTTATTSSPWRKGDSPGALLGERVAIWKGTVVMSQRGSGAVLVSEEGVDRKIASAADAQFGQAVATDRGSIVVGGTSNHFFSASGALFELVMPSDAAPSHSAMGWGYDSVAIDREVVVVGGRGEAYMFSTSGFLFAKLKPEGSTDMSFGESVAMDDGVVVIGSPTEGAVYTFNTDLFGPQQLGKMVADPDDHNDDKESEFGCAIAADEGVIAIGAWRADVVYLFTATGERLGKFGNGDQGIRFGYALAMEGSQIVVGAPGARRWVGSAYVYDVLGNQQKKLMPRDAAEPGEAVPLTFGWSVAINQGKVVVGAPLGENSMGSVYVFDA